MTAAKRATTKKTTVAKVVSKAKVSKPKAAASHPPFKQMITEAITALNEKSGSSRQAVLKYISDNYKVDVKVGNKFIKAGLISGVNNGSLKRVKGVGASGSFKLAEKVKTSRPKAVKIKEKRQKAPAKKAAVSKPKAVPKKKTLKKVVKSKAKKSPAKKTKAKA